MPRKVNRARILATLERIDADTPSMRQAAVVVVGGHSYRPDILFSMETVNEAGLSPYGELGCFRRDRAEDPDDIGVRYNPLNFG